MARKDRNAGPSRARPAVPGEQRGVSNIGTVAVSSVGNRQMPRVGYLPVASFDAVVDRLAQRGMKMKPLCQYWGADDKRKDSSWPSIGNYMMTADVRSELPGSVSLPAPSWAVVAKNHGSTYSLVLGTGVLSGDTLGMLLTLDLTPPGTSYEGDPEALVLGNLATLRERINTLTARLRDEGFLIALGRKLQVSANQQIREGRPFANPPAIRAALASMPDTGDRHTQLALAEVIAAYLRAHNVLAPSEPLVELDHRPRRFPRVYDIVIEGMRLDVEAAVSNAVFVVGDLKGSDTYYPDAFFAALASSTKKFAMSMMTTLPNATYIYEALQMVRFSLEGSAAEWKAAQLSSDMFQGSALSQLQANHTIVGMTRELPVSPDLTVTLTGLMHSTALSKLLLVLQSSPRWEIVDIKSITPNLSTGVTIDKSSNLRATVYHLGFDLRPTPVLVQKFASYNTQAVLLATPPMLQARVETLVPSVADAFTSATQGAALLETMSQVPVRERDLKDERSWMLVTGVHVEDLEQLMDHWAAAQAVSLSYSINEVGQRTGLIYHVVGPFQRVFAGGIVPADSTYTSNPALVLLLKTGAMDRQSGDRLVDGRPASLVGQIPDVMARAHPIARDALVPYEGPSLSELYRIPITTTLGNSELSFTVELQTSAMLELPEMGGMSMMKMPSTVAYLGAAFRAPFELHRAIADVADLKAVRVELLAARSARRLLEGLAPALKSHSVSAVRHRIYAYAQRAFEQSGDNHLTAELFALAAQPSFKRQLGFRSLLFILEATGHLDQNDATTIAAAIQGSEDILMIED